MAPTTPPCMIQSPVETTQAHPIMAPKANTNISHKLSTLLNSEVFRAITKYLSFIVHQAVQMYSFDILMLVDVSTTVRQLVQSDRIAHMYILPYRHVFCILLIFAPIIKGTAPKGRNPLKLFPLLYFLFCRFRQGIHYGLCHSIQFRFFVGMKCRCHGNAFI